MLKAIHSSYVVRYVNYLETEKYAVLLMELVGKSLKSIEIRSDPEVDEVRSIFREVLLGLHDLH
jgi:serine/threonine protein kinase